MSHPDGDLQTSARGMVNLLSGLSNAHVVGHTRGIHTLSTHRYKPPRFPAEIISHAVW
jgi:hypothetical protein